MRFLTIRHHRLALTRRRARAPLHVAAKLTVSVSLVLWCYCLAHGQVEEPAAVAALLRDAARPIDRIQLENGETAEVEPLAADMLLDPQFPGSITARGIAAGAQPPRQYLVTRDGVKGYVPFERWALDRLVQFDKDASTLAPLIRQAAAENVLTAVLAFHLSARDRPLQGSNRWADLQAEVERKLLDVRRKMLRGYTLAAHDAEAWQQALRYGDFVGAAYPGDNEILAAVAQLRSRYILSLVLQSVGPKETASHVKAIRQQLEWLEDHVPRPPPPDLAGLLGDTFLQSASPFAIVYDPDSQVIGQWLERKAAQLVGAARAAKDDKQALRYLEAAEELWPRLPGLRDEILKHRGQYAILYVGVRGLPIELSPARAWTDVERQALELLFEGLVQTRPAEDGRLSYHPRLAATTPLPASSERRLNLRPTAYWSSGTRVTSADVFKTFELLTAKTMPGRSAELADSLEPMRVGNDPWRAAFRCNQGLLDPLAPLAFKVLPRGLADASDEKFAREPVGSGPFMLAKPLAEHGRSYLRFVANPYYLAAPGRPLPQIREVRFFVSKDPAGDFANKVAPMHLLLDARTQDLGLVKKAGARLAATAPERRVWFLAVNHREPLLADEKLRRALAHGIDRERLLADHFGSGVAAFRAGPLAVWGASGPVVAAAMARGTASHHQALNGPFPAGSWAVCPDERVPARLNNPATAETFLRGVKAASVELELKYPDDDPRVQAACEAMAEQLADLGTRVGRPLKLRLVSLPPRQLQRDVLARKYQLAYWHHDYPTDLYSLWPLFDPRDGALQRGSNFLGYKDDGSLVELLQKAASYRDFTQVKRLTHDIHVALFEKMPLVPLWQLDYHIAVHPNLTTGLLDPRAVFGSIDEWRLESK
jgi:ABC-type transport system substrate-binding protein